MAYLVCFRALSMTPEPSTDAESEGRSPGPLYGVEIWEAAGREVEGAEVGPMRVFVDVEDGIGNDGTVADIGGVGGTAALLLTAPLPACAVVREDEDDFAAGAGACTAVYEMGEEETGGSAIFGIAFGGEGEGVGCC